jgi:predicted RNase H-like HicB family nuclease
MSRYLVIYERGPTSWGAYVPDLPGVVAAAPTRPEVEQLIRDAIRFHIEGLVADGEPVPGPATEAGTVFVVV